MGNFLQTLQGHEIIQSKLTIFRQFSLSNIQQSNGKFRYLCDTFAIDQSQFVEIFGDCLEIFRVFDDDENLLIDGLELFTGLILFTDNCKFQDKIKFIFNIYDFNEMNSLSKTDLEFLFLSSCSACYKILGIKAKPKHDEIVLLVNSLFPEKQRVNINQMLKWAITSPQIISLFEIVEQKPKPLPDIQKIYQEKVYIKNNVNTFEQNLFKQKKKQWLDNLIKRTKTRTQYPSQIQHSDIKLEIEHVIGFRSHDLKHSILHVVIDGRNYLLYCSACIIIIYLIGSSHQQFYAEHKNQVISLCNYNDIIASGEIGVSPYIHIWDLKTRNTIKVIKGTHRKGVHILKFIQNGRKLIACGLGQQTSPIYIYNTSNYQLIKALSIQFPIVQLIQINQFKVIEDEKPKYLMGTTHSCYTFSEKMQQIMTKRMTNFTCFQLIHLNSRRKYLRYYEQNDAGLRILLTGTQSGIFSAWDIDKNNKKLFEKKYQSEVVKIDYIKQYIVVATFSSSIQLFDYYLNLYHTIDITSLGIKLFSYNVIDFISFGNNIVVSTGGGEIIKLQQNQEKQLEYKVEKIKTMISLKGQQNVATIIKNQKKQILYIGGSEGIIIGIDLSLYQIVDIWRLNENITALDVIQYNNKNYLAAGTKQGMIYLRVNLQQIEKSFKFRKQITDLKFVIRKNKELSLIATSINGRIYIFDNIATANLTSRHKLEIENQIPLSICAQNQRIMINTENNSIYLLSLIDKKHREIKQSDNQCTVGSHLMKLSYNHKQLAKFDLVISSKLIASANTSGGISVWRDKQSFNLNKKFALTHHKSKVNCILINKNLSHLITIGKKDNSIIIYKILFSQIPSIYNEELIIQKPELEVDQILDKEIQYCIYNNNLMNECKDQHLLVRGLKHSQLTTFLNSLMQKWSENNVEQPSRQSPPVNLKLSYVYGLQSYQRRNNLLCVENPRRYLFYTSRIVVVQHPHQNIQQFYLGHRFKVTCLCLIDSECVASGESASLPTIHIWNYHNMSTIRIIETGFKYGILNMVLNTNNLIVCGLENKVSYDDRQIPSHGFSVYNVHQGINVANRSQGLQKIYSMSSNPVSANQFCTTGVNIVNFWEIKDKTIQKVSECFSCQTITASVYYDYVLNKTHKTDLIVGTYMGCIGVIVNKNKFIKLKQRAHSKFINCIRWIQIGTGKNRIDLFITSSEDETIKVWNKYFQCLFDQDIKKIDDYKQMFKITVDKKIIDKYNFDHNLSIQSISYWNKQDNSNDLQFLISSRNGEVLLFNYNIKEQNGKINLWTRNHSSQINEPSNKRVFFAVHPKFQIMVTIGEDLNLFIWDTQKNKLITSKFLGYIALPTCIQFNGDGDILAIGFSDGLVILYDCKILRPNMAKSEEKYLAPTLNELQKNKSEKKSAVLNIQFSETGEFLAVSFDNCYSSSNLHTNTGTNFYSHSQSRSNKTFIESSYIVIYVSLHANKYLKKQLAPKPNDKVYSEFHRIPLEQAGTLYETQHNNKYGMAAYYLTYLQSYVESQKSEKKTYLLIYYQIFDSKQVRINHLTETKYILWDIDACSVVISLQPLNQIHWKKLNFPNSLSCRYQLYQNQNQGQTQSTKTIRTRSNKLHNNNLLKADMTAMITLSSQKSLNDYMILGSLNGDLHIASTYSIEYQNGIGQQFLAKTIPAHSSFVNHIDIDPFSKYLFSSGLQDQVVMKWKIVHQPRVRHITKQSVKFFKDQPKTQQFQCVLQQFRERDQVNLLQLPRVINHKIQPHRVIGRRTTGVRSKVFYNQDDKIVYSVGPNILIYDKSTTNLKMITGNVAGSIDEISSMVVSENGRFCLTTTAGTHATLTLWEINSQTLLDKIVLFQIVYPLFIRMSSNNKRVLMYGLDEKLKSIVMLIDIDSQKVLGRMKVLYADSSSIRDGGFIKNSINKFIICGSNHLTLWQYQGNEIVYQNLEVYMDKQPDQKYIFLCFLAIQNKFITGCHEGYLHLWADDGKFITKESGHQQLCENIVCNGKYILSTGRDMKLIVWNIQSNRLSKDYIFTLRDYFVREIYQFHSVDDTYKWNKVRRIEENDSIMSVCIKGNKVLLDTKYGSIYQFYFEESRLNQITTSTEVLNLNNRHKVVGMFFTKDNKYIYYITSKGVLSIWDIDNFKCVEEKHFQKQTLDMILCEDTNYYFISFITEVFVLEVGKQLIQNIFLSKQQIKAIAVSKRSNQPIIAIAQKQEDYCKILVYYYFPITDKPSKITQIHKQKNKLQYKTQISMSFSPKADQLLIMIDGKDFAMPLIFEQEKKSMNNLMNEKQSPKYIFKNDPRTEPIIEMYKNDKNPIMDIQEINPSMFLVGDTIGTLRLFQIQSNKEPKLIDYSFAHMNQISKIRISHDKKTAASYSKIDESIIIWKMERYDK